MLKSQTEWDINIYLGILTGLNEAFIIDEKTKDEILNFCLSIDEKNRTKELIKPILRGRDIKRYSYDLINLNQPFQSELIKAKRLIIYEIARIWRNLMLLQCFSNFIILVVDLAKV